MSTSQIFCSDCGTQLKDSASNCSECGSGNKRLEIEETITITDQIKARVKDRTTPGNVIEFTVRTKIAGKSGNLAREEIVINRRDNKETIKSHKVEEFIDGKWEVVHEHSEPFKAKRR